MFEILVVDNHPLIREFMSELLGREGYQVLLAEDGLAAVDMLHEHRPRVMFLDLIMPNIDGETLCRIIRSWPEHKDAFLVVLSATAAETPVLPQECRANAFIAKGPFKSMAAHVLQTIELAKQSDFKAVSREVLGLEDIHAREITKELLALKRHFEVVLASMDEGIFEINSEGRIVFANGAAIALTGMVEEQLLSTAFTHLFAETQRARIEAYLAGALSGESSGVIQGLEVRLGERDLELRVYSIQEERGKAIVLIVDITERKRFEDQLRRSQRMESIGTLAAGVAHDFNNLLTVVQGNADIMMMDLQQTHPHYERLEEVLKQVQSAKRLTGQLLGYARKGRFEVRLLDLNELIRETVETFGRTRKDISIDVDLDPQLELFEGDADQIEQMVLNLLLNAGDAMPSGGSLRIVTRNVSHRDMSEAVFKPKEGRYLRIEVSDTGIGMDAKTRERIFEPFFTTKAMGRGTGLGLASSYGTVKGHGGYIEVQSAPGKGTTFRIFLPVMPADPQQPEKDGEQDRAGDSRTASRGAVLLVDDEQAVRNVARDSLNKLGFDVLAAAGGEEALDLYRQRRQEIVLVILDIIMPGMGGSQVFHELKQQDSGLKILLCSGYSIEGEAERLLGLGASGFIQKPFSLKALSSAIDDILGRQADKEP